ncbi:MAG: hypothetical protein PPHEMADM_5576 [uncultured Paraburkholderia sp.]|nr:MAG: hypothetical protein PPHEINF_6119 [uncultured Paraburkholderia sp.]CAH2809220.1 MAG: hypothetical protein PPHEESC_6085 [uncultured Paraburkholderia sp.]CAH2904705.1 MAG: hypothetical protein PPHEMADE_5598 [uncultured Paraburkholderia sp.]CAH2944421.1 MAG: hypothetical protein PPHEMADMSA_6143 [uncultured Paraburkholderia sp.]CAH2944687.1 MAG: hypothetical protein PPHERAN_6117 [uncultured Paraburkholderia sp.]
MSFHDLAQRFTVTVGARLDMLNRLTHDYPDAISLASGRPSDSFCTLGIAQDAIACFTDYARQRGGG